MSDVRFKIIEHNSFDYKNAIILREAVLRIPLGMKYSPNDLMGEEYYIHLAGFLNNKIVASAMLVPEGDACKMKQVAVDINLQSKGIGSELVKFSEKIAIDHGFKKIHCHARHYAVEFYKKNNFIPVGDYFTEINMPHVKMVRCLV